MYAKPLYDIEIMATTSKDTSIRIKSTRFRLDMLKPSHDAFVAEMLLYFETTGDHPAVECNAAEHLRPKSRQAG